MWEAGGEPPAEFSAACRSTKLLESTWNLLSEMRGGLWGLPYSFLPRWFHFWSRVHGLSLSDRHPVHLYSSQPHDPACKPKP